eukprot:m.1341677 g.1341677  ORF g.1341677 m.1341677 type:complete len:742 (-) comp24896_c0_seq5:1788-4013(-)
MSQNCYGSQVFSWSLPSRYSASSLLLFFCTLVSDASGGVDQMIPMPSLVNLTCDLQCHTAIIERRMDTFTFGFEVPASGPYEFSTCGPQCPPDNVAMNFEVCCGDSVTSRGCTWETRVLLGRSACPAPGQDKNPSDPLTPVNLTEGEQCIFSLFRHGSSFAERVSMQVYCPPPKAPPIFECGASGASYSYTVASMIPQAAARDFVLRGQTTPNEYAGGPYRIETCGSGFPTNLTIDNITLQGTPCDDESAGQIYFYSPRRPTATSTRAPEPVPSTPTVNASTPDVTPTALLSTSGAAHPTDTATSTVGALQEQHQTHQSPVVLSGDGQEVHMPGTTASPAELNNTKAAGTWTISSNASSAAASTPGTSPTNTSSTAVAVNTTTTLPVLTTRSAPPGTITTDMPFTVAFADPTVAGALSVSVGCSLKCGDTVSGASGVWQFAATQTGNYSFSTCSSQIGASVSLGSGEAPTGSCATDVNCSGCRGIDGRCSANVTVALAANSTYTIDVKACNESLALALGSRAVELSVSTCKHAITPPHNGSNTGGHSGSGIAATTIVGIVLASSVFLFLCYTLCCKRGERVPLSITSGGHDDADSQVELDTLPDVYNLTPVEDANAGDTSKLLSKAPKHKNIRTKTARRKVPGSKRREAPPPPAPRHTLSRTPDVVQWGAGDTVLTTGRDGMLTMEPRRAPDHHPPPVQAASSGSDDDDVATDTLHCWSCPGTAQRSNAQFCRTCGRALQR